MRHVIHPLLVCVLLSASHVFAEAPRLVLQITVDGLRADFIDRYSRHFGRDGFKLLLQRGTVYTNAYYQHANTETIVGHATLATGATPAVHGMIGNVWYHAESGELGYNIEDPQAPLLPTRADTRSGAQVDPAQQRARTQGRSPREILVPTFSDTLVLANRGVSKNFGVSGKDRSAVAMAGHSGIAYWYSTDSGDFQTSSYYMDAYPQWVQAWNDKRKADRHSNTEWTLSQNIDRYLHRAQDDRPYEIDLKGYGRTFPHAFGSKDHPLFYTRLMVSAEGDALLADFAIDLIKQESLGDDKVTDYLSVSFSGVDAVNHFFGPGSLENEEAMVRLDATLTALFRSIDKRIGLEHTLIVLSADHGMAEMPEYAAEMGQPAARLYSDELLEIARTIAEDRFGNADLVKDFFRPYLYLNRPAIAEAKLDINQVAQVIARSLESNDGVGGAITAQEALAGLGPATEAAAAVRANHHPQRAGDIYVYPQPYWFMFERGPIGVMHGSPWDYDRHVPIIFAGKGIKSQRINRRVHPADVAPTLSALLRIPQPAGAQGAVLTEVMPTR